MEPNVHVETDGETAALYFAVRTLLDSLADFRSTYDALANLKDVVATFEASRVRTSTLE